MSEPAEIDREQAFVAAELLRTEILERDLHLLAHERSEEDDGRVLRPGLVGAHARVSDAVEDELADHEVPAVQLGAGRGRLGSGHDPVSFGCGCDKAPPFWG